MKCALVLMPLLFLGLMGCVNSPVPIEPRLMVAQSSDGGASMTWESSPEYQYTIFFRDGEAPWQELPSVVRVRGTGRTMVANDQAPPTRKVVRRYRVHFEKTR